MIATGLRPHYDELLSEQIHDHPTTEPNQIVMLCGKGPRPDAPGIHGYGASSSLLAILISAGKAGAPARQVWVEVHRLRQPGDHPRNSYVAEMICLADCFYHDEQADALIERAYQHVHVTQHEEAELVSPRH